jgi:hypothetical protein
VVKGATNVRKQFLVLNSKTIIGFVPSSGKFSDCAATGFTDVTSSVTCKVCPPTYIYTDSGSLTVPPQDSLTSPAVSPPRFVHRLIFIDSGL